MKPNWQQQQQEQMKRQQDMMRQKQMQASWAQQQEMKPSEIQTPIKSGRSDSFTNVENQARQLVEMFNAKAISKENMDKQLKDMMIQDSSGAWWMISTEDWSWYKNDGRNWMKATPPGRLLSSVSYTGETKSTIKKSLPKRRPVRAILGFIFGIILTYGIGSLFYSYFPYSYRVGKIITWGIWAVGFIIVWRASRKLWRGY